MTVVAIARVKDEQDIIEATVGHMLGQVDHVIVEDNASTDGTLETLRALGVEVLQDPTVGYFQSAAMSRLAAYAATEHGATFVVPFDADEFWYSPFSRIADVLADHHGAVAVADIFDHRATAADPADGSPLERMGWRARNPLPLHKVACRPVLPVTIDQGNHGARYPTQDPLRGHLVVRHYPYRSPEQLIRKARNGAAAYAATDLPEEVGKHWRDYGRLSDEQLGDVFRQWFWTPRPEADPSLIFDPCPLSSHGVPPAPTADALGAT